MHEYAHHFMAENAPYLVPRWYGEGFAEYFATAKFETDGTVGLGLPAGPVIASIHEKRDEFRHQLQEAAGAAGRSETRSIRAKTLRRS